MELLWDVTEQIVQLAQEAHRLDEDALIEAACEIARVATGHEPTEV